MGGVRAGCAESDLDVPQRGRIQRQTRRGADARKGSDAEPFEMSRCAVLLDQGVKDRGNEEAEKNVGTALEPIVGPASSMKPINSRGRT
jgi:hypothetical protein